MAFGNLTVDFRKLSKIPVRDRVTLAKSPVGSEIFGNLSPTEIAALFPDYYKKFIPTGGGGASMSAGMTGAGYTGGGGDTGTAPSTGGATPAPTGPVVPALIQEILDSAGISSSERNDLKMSSGQQKLLGLIASGEGGYNSSNRGTLDGRIMGSTHNTVRDGKSIPDMTVAEIMKFQSINDPRNPKRLFAVGKYQLIPSTFKGAVDFLGLKPTDKLTPEIQEKMGLYLIMEKRPAVGRYIRGESDDLLAAQKALALEFASIPVPIDMTVEGNFRPAGASAYGSGNRAAHSIKEVESALQTARQDHLETQSGNVETALPGTEPITGEAPQGSDVGIEQIGSDGTATVVPQTQSFDPAIFTQLDPRIQEYYNTATEDQKKQLEYALMKTGVAKVNEIAQRHPRATADVVTTTVVQDAQQSAMNVSEAINQDPLEFWKARNPQGARIEDLDQETLRTAMMAAIKLEADMTAKGAPKKVEIYGPISGVRTDPKLEKSRHGLNFKEALDVAIYDVDPNTGQKIEKGMPGAKSGPYGNYPNIPGHGGIDPEGFALYHEFGQNAELARMFLANRGDERYQGWGIRQGQLFSAKGAQYDFMHIDRSAGVNPETGVSTHVAPHGVGSVAGGMTEAGVRKLGIDPNSDAGRRLMTGVTERFGKTRQDIALYAEAAYGPRPGVETTATQSLPGTESQTQTAPTIDTQIEPIGQAKTNMALGGTRSTDVEPNMVNEKYTIAQTDPKTGETKPIANFNKNEEVNIKDGQMDVESSYKKQAKETGDKNDKGMQQTNHYTMRQSSSKNVPNLLHETTVQPSPSLQRAFRNSRFSDHFSYGSRNTDT